METQSLDFGVGHVHSFNDRISGTQSFLRPFATNFDALISWVVSSIVCCLKHGLQSLFSFLLHNCNCPHISIQYPPESLILSNMKISFYITRAMLFTQAIKFKQYGYSKTITSSFFTVKQFCKICMEISFCITLAMLSTSSSSKAILWIFRPSKG